MCTHPHTCIPMHAPLRVSGMVAGSAPIGRGVRSAATEAPTPGAIRTQVCMAPIHQRWALPCLESLKEADSIEADP